MTCCAALEKVLEEYQYPFYYPVMIDTDTLDMRVGTLSVKLRKETRAGNISKRDGMVVYVTYCPWCGEKLRETE